MANKNQSLFNAISGVTNKTPAPKAERAPAIATNDDAPRPVRQAGREGKFNLSTYLETDYKTSLRAIQVKQPNRQLQDLIAEALNDLFAKYNVPTISVASPPVKRRS